MKKLFSGVGGGGRRRRADSEESPAGAGNTLDKLVRDKEGVRKRLEDEEKEFIIRKREYVTNLIHIEKQEIERRERELDSKTAELQEKRRLNQQVKDKYEEQMRLLQKSFEEVKSEHAKTETEMEADIAILNDKLNQVRLSLQEKVGEEELAEPSAPEANLYTLYPDLQNYRTQSIGSRQRHGSGGSTGSAQQISITSSASANSAKSDSDS